MLGEHVQRGRRAHAIPRFIYLCSLFQVQPRRKPSIADSETLGDSEQRPCVAITAVPPRVVVYILLLSDL